MFHYVFQSKRVVLAYFCLAILTYGCLVMFFQTYGWITEVSLQNQLNAAYQVTFVCVGILATILLLLYALAFVKRYAMFYISRQLRQDVFLKIYSQNIPDYLKQDSGYYVSMLTNDVSTIEDDYFSKLYELLGDVVQIALTLGMIFFLGWQYALIVLLFLIPTLIHPFLLKGALGRHGGYVSATLGEYVGKMSNFIHSFELIRSFRAEKRIEEQFHCQSKKLESTRFRSDRIKSLNAMFMILAIYFLKIGSQLYFIDSAVNGMAMVATVAILFGLANNMGNPAASILDYIASINATKGVRDKILTWIKDAELASNGKELDSDRIEIESKGMSFSYQPEKTIINSLDIQFKSGKKYLILGKSGCGKSTLFKVLQGHYPQYTGELLVNGVPLRDYHVRSIWRHIAMIHQNVFVFHGTFKDNITMLHQEYSEADILSAIEKAKLSDVVSKLPEGINTYVSEGGKNFSGGEKQRIAIARALLSGAKVLLVDEGTSALDNVTAVAIEKMLLELDDVTVIAISHRTNETFVLYDQVFQMEKGQASLISNPEGALNV